MCYSLCSKECRTENEEGLFREKGKQIIHVKSEFMERYMEYIRDRESNIPFSLHDSRILQIEYNKATLTLRVDRIFQYVGDEEKWYQGIIEFTKADIEECDIMLFNRPYGYDGENDPIFGIMRIWNTGDMIYRI